MTWISPRQHLSEFTWLCELIGLDFLFVRVFVSAAFCENWSWFRRDLLYSLHKSEKKRKCSQLSSQVRIKERRKCTNVDKIRTLHFPFPKSLDSKIKRAEMVSMVWKRNTKDAFSFFSVFKEFYYHDFLLDLAIQPDSLIQAERRKWRLQSQEWRFSFFWR